MAFPQHPAPDPGLWSPGPGFVHGGRPGPRERWGSYHEEEQFRGPSRTQEKGKAVGQDASQTQVNNRSPEPAGLAGHAVAGHPSHGPSVATPALLDPPHNWAVQERGGETLIFPSLCSARVHHECACFRKAGPAR